MTPINDLKPSTLGRNRKANIDTKGIFSLYTENAREYIQHRLHKPHTIDRARFELILFEQLAKSDLETNYKISWCHAVSSFLSFYPFSLQLSPSQPKSISFLHMRYTNHEHSSPPSHPPQESIKEY